MTEDVGRWSVGVLVHVPMPGIFVKLIVNAIDQSLPAGFDDVMRNPHSSPAIFAVAGLDQNPN
jgi:hypothetical protein